MVEKSRVEAWGWRIRGWNVLQTSIVGSIPPIKVICLRISGWQVISFKIFSDPSWHFGSSVSSKFVRISKPPESMIANWTWSFRKSKSCYNLEVAIMENWGFEETLFINSLGISNPIFGLSWPDWPNFGVSWFLWCFRFKKTGWLESGWTQKSKSCYNLKGPIKYYWGFEEILF